MFLLGQGSPFSEMQQAPPPPPPQLFPAREINSWLEGGSFEVRALAVVPLMVAFLGLQYGLVEHLSLKESLALGLLRDFKDWGMLLTGEKPRILSLVLQESVKSREADCLVNFFGPFCPSSEERARGSQQDYRPRAMRERQMHCRAVSLAAYCLRTEC